MADAVVNFLVENLLQLLNDNIDLIKGVDEEFQNLLDEVQHLKAFLDDAARYQSESKLWNKLVKDIQRMVNKAEDAIDKFLVQSKLHRDKNKVGRFFDVGHMNTVKNLAAEIKGIHEKVKKLRENNKIPFTPNPTIEFPEKEPQQAKQVILHI